MMKDRFQIILAAFFEWFKKFFYNFVCFIINHGFFVVTFWMHYMLFIITYREIIAIANWITHVADFLRLFMISFKCGLILLRYFSTDSVLFPSPYFHIRCNLCWFIIIFFFISKRFLISLSILSLITLFYFFNLKRFFKILIVVSSITVFNLKRFVTFLIMLIIFKTWTFHPFMLWKKLIILFEKIKVYYTPQKAF